MVFRHWLVRSVAEDGIYQPRLVLGVVEFLSARFLGLVVLLYGVDLGGVDCCAEFLLFQDVRVWFGRVLSLAEFVWLLFHGLIPCWYLRYVSGGLILGQRQAGTFLPVVAGNVMEPELGGWT